MESINSSQKKRSIPRLKDLDSICQTILNDCEKGRIDKVITLIDLITDWLGQIDDEVIINGGIEVGRDMDAIIQTANEASRILIMKGYSL